MKDVLEKLFGSPARVKVIRLFLQNPSDLFIPTEISRRCKINSNVARREISVLIRAGLIKQKKSFLETILKLKNGKIKNKKKKIQGLGINEFFPFINPLRSLFIESASFNKEKIIKSLKSAGDMKMIVLSGIFMQSNDSSVDLLLVGDRIQKNKLERILKRIEIEMGKEVSFALFDTKDFLYRFSMHDKFIHDILNSPHEKACCKLEI
ncbi:hypothetical protein KJ763_02505 [Patescibacteria group bacterium]|nr:hypothetical protein [Patescibacteria group bacterium]